MSENKKKVLNAPYGIIEVEYDGCQYIIYKDYERGGLTHKGNCTNH